MTCTLQRTYVHYSGIEEEIALIYKFYPTYILLALSGIFFSRDLVLLEIPPRLDSFRQTLTSIITPAILEPYGLVRGQSITLVPWQKSKPMV